jgi:hypothetical protein
MRTPGVLALLLAVAAADEPDRTLLRAQAYAKRGSEALDAARAARTSGQRLAALGRAEFLLRRADELAARTEDLGLQSRVRVALIDAMVRRAGAYYERTSLPQAKQQILAALALEPSHALGKALLAAIKRAEEEDTFDSVDGIVAIDRIRARRLAAGAPLRDRGVSRRR